MKTKLQLLFIGLVLAASATELVAQGTTFTYQGRLNIGGVPYTGNAAFIPTLWDASTGGNLVTGNSPTGATVAVTNGLFVLPLNFGMPFTGAARWLQLEVSTNGEPSTTLAPRQQLTPTPYAIYSANSLSASNVTGTVSASQLSGQVSGAQIADGRGCRKSKQCRGSASRRGRCAGGTIHYWHRGQWQRHSRS